ncbi:MAG: hypothetical protein HYV14_10545 [Elusimicrobia bacterium]|nr:hypothetical protein [Elusimicrobiota bacterium]
MVMRRIVGRCATGLALLALAAGAGRGWPEHAAAAGKAETVVAEWPEPSRRTALAMIEKLGEPHRRDADSLTWIGVYRGKRTVIRRSSTSQGMVEQTVFYRVPAEKIRDLALFDDRISVDRKASELTARTQSVRTSFLVLNLAHEIASGFTTPEKARRVRDKELRLAEAGKSSRYRDGLIFEEPLPLVLPARVAPPVLPADASAP